MHPHRTLQMRLNTQLVTNYRTSLPISHQTSPTTAPSILAGSWHHPIEHPLAVAGNAERSKDPDAYCQGAERLE
jgi:hypothetical protein